MIVPATKEQTMKTTVTHTVFKLATLLAVAAPLAAVCGLGKWG